MENWRRVAIYSKQWYLVRDCHLVFRFWRASSSLRSRSTKISRWGRRARIEKTLHSLRFIDDKDGLAQQRYVKSHRNLLRSPHSGPHPGTPYRLIQVTGVGRPLDRSSTSHKCKYLVNGYLYVVPWNIRLPMVNDARIRRPYEAHPGNRLEPGTVRALLASRKSGDLSWCGRRVGTLAPNKRLSTARFGSEEQG
jgi:hypothetical protein